MAGVEALVIDERLESVERVTECAKATHVDPTEFSDGAVLRDIVVLDVKHGVLALLFALN